jgi:putative spermidine/putrescine transport system ATP-binding protein
MPGPRAEPLARPVLEASPAEGYLTVIDVAKQFGPVEVLNGITLSAGRGELLSILGPSGCGKTTLLRVIAGFLRPDAGQIRLDGRDLTGLPAHRRNVGVVFQSYALFPHLTVAENVAFGLKARGVPRADIRREVAKALALVRLSDLAERSIQALSGGQQQRVAVARALAVKPSLVLLDEPFNALDRKLREVMQIELGKLLRELDVTAIFVTHDQDEALVLSDRVAVVHAGRVEQLAEPPTIYARPATPFVLDFVGSSLKLHGRVVAQAGGEIRVETASAPVTAPGAFAVGTRVMVAVRPERIEFGEPPDRRHNAATMTVSDVIFHGARIQVHFACAEGDRALAETSDPAGQSLAPGTRLTLRWPIAATLAYEVG